MHRSTPTCSSLRQCFSPPHCPLQRTTGSLNHQSQCSCHPLGECCYWICGSKIKLTKKKVQLLLRIIKTYYSRGHSQWVIQVYLFKLYFTQIFPFAATFNYTTIERYILLILPLVYSYTVVTFGFLQTFWLMASYSEQNSSKQVKIWIYHYFINKKYLRKLNRNWCGRTFFFAT